MSGQDVQIETDVDVGDGTMVNIEDNARSGLNVEARDDTTTRPNVATGKPTGAHTCVVCKVAVHAMDACSSPYCEDAEGYGQRRICKKCTLQENVPDILASRQFENWGGLAEPGKQTSQSGRYLKEKYAQNEFILEDKIKKLPILKNGSDQTLKPIAIDKENFTLSNTCAFDSIFQIFLTATSDHAKFREWIETHKMAHAFFNMVFEVLKHGVTAIAYRARCNILLPIYTRGSEALKCTELLCQITIGDLGRKLFQDAPSFQDELVCSKACSSKITNLGLVMITQAALLDESYNTKIEQEITLPENNKSARKCPTFGCTGDVLKSLQAPGNFVVFEVVPGEDMAENEPVMLQNIPKTLQLSFMDEACVLTGVAHFKKPRTRTSGDKVLIQSIGHYTALCYRKGTWIEFDDTKESGKRQPNKREIALHLVIYVR